MRHIFLSVGLAVVLSGCGDPLRNVARLDDVTVADGAVTATPTPAETRNTGGGLFGRLLNRQPDDPTNAAVEAALADAATSEVTEEGSEIEAEVVAEPEPEAAPERRGLFGIFRGNRDTAQTSEATPEAETAEVTPVAMTQSADAPATPRGGLAGLFRRSPDAAPPRNGPDSEDVSAGTVLPFGQIARVCGLRRSELGTEVDGGGGFKIYDTIPNSTAPRPFYITGFNDDCARTFTGAVVVTGDIETHEFVRYQGSNERIGYTSTDNAYEALKASVCRVGRGLPCGARADRLNSNTHFVTVYDFFGGTFSAVPTEWAQILIHDGRVLGMSVKDG